MVAEVPQFEAKLILSIGFLCVLFYFAWRLKKTIQRSNEIMGYDFDGEPIAPQGDE